MRVRGGGGSIPGASGGAMLVEGSAWQEKSARYIIPRKFLRKELFVECPFSSIDDSSIIFAVHFPWK